MSETRKVAVALMKCGMNAREALRRSLMMVRDDRPLYRHEERGNGNRFKRRMGWTLERWYCFHMNGGYDCCCEPQGGYYYVATPEYLMKAVRF